MAKKKKKFNSIIASYIQTNIADAPSPYVAPEAPAEQDVSRRKWTRDKPDPVLAGFQDAKAPVNRPSSAKDRFREVEVIREGRLSLVITEDPQGRYSYSIERELHDGRKIRHLHPRDADDLLKLAECARDWFKTHQT